MRNVNRPIRLSNVAGSLFALAAVAFVTAVAWPAQMPAMDVTSPAPGPLEAMPAALESEFALSALPPKLRSAATVYRLDPARGYVVHRQGANGLSCFVERAEWDRADFRNDVYTPICYDVEGAKHHMRVRLDAARLRAQGRTADQVRREIARRFRNRAYSAPARSGISYMAAPMMRTYPSPDPSDKRVMTMSAPHFMFYAPNARAAHYVNFPTTAPPEPYPFLFQPGPHGYAVVFVGVSERDKIVADHAALLKRMCEYRKFLCLSQ